MPLHLRIKELFDALRNKNFENILSKEAFEFLKVNGATATEAAITISLGFDIPEEEADTQVRLSKIFPDEEISDIAYQTFTYL